MEPHVGHHLYHDQTNRIIMTNEQINRAIAEACGWHSITTTGIHGMKGPLRGFMQIPNYCADLNAMHGAEEAITGVLWRDYFERLQRHGKASGIRATARQRAEAFLRTLGKWATAEDCSAVGEEVQK
jgi:hypothetical protein